MLVSCHTASRSGLKCHRAFLQCQSRCPPGPSHSRGLAPLCVDRLLRSSLSFVTLMEAARSLQVLSLLRVIHHSDYNSSVWFCGHTQWPETTGIQRLVRFSREQLSTHRLPWILPQDLRKRSKPLRHLSSPRRNCSLISCLSFKLQACEYKYPQGPEASEPEN